MENNKKVSAIDWFWKQCKKWEEEDPDFRFTAPHTKEFYEQAKQMEKEQIINARANGFIISAEGWNGEVPCMKWSEIIRETKCEEYYNETYGKI